MSIQLKVPEVGESITEVQIGEWLKSEGDAVKRDEVLVMIETDKVTVELPSPVDGVLTKISTQNGEPASVGDVIGEVREGQASSEQDSDESPRETKSQSASKRAKSKTPADSGDSDKGSSDETSNQEPRVMPAAARAMAQAGLEVSQVEGTGPGGRILKEDVERAKDDTEPRKPRSSLPPPSAKQPAEKSDTPVNAPSEGYREEEVVRMSPMRKRIAERLVQAQQTAALLTTFNEIDMSQVIQLRKQYQPMFTEKYGIKLGFMSIFVKAAVDALKSVPAVNAQVRDDSIVYRNYYDVGVAVGGGKGLVVPVIRNAERLSFAEVEKTIADFGKRAKDNQLKLDELQGGTFTISNGGIYGSLMSTPIINPPQSGILGLHAIQERAVAVDGQVVVRPMMYVALTYDHRVVDGREAVTFLKRVKETVEAPARMLIEV